jgi:hypothetical protein
MPLRRPDGHDLDALRAQAHRVLHRALHRATEHDSLLELLGDAVRRSAAHRFRACAPSSMLTATRHAETAGQLGLQISMSSPFLPITTPGRAEKIVMRAFLAGRSMRMRENGCALQAP